MLRLTIGGICAASAAAAGCAGDSAQCAFPANDDLASLLQTPRSSAARLSKEVSDSWGIVGELYTYGAVATASPPLTDGAHENGDFPGARVYTASRTTAPAEVDMATLLADNLLHAKELTVKLFFNESDFSGDVSSPAVDEPHKLVEYLHKQFLYLDWLKAALRRQGEVKQHPQILHASQFCNFATWAYNATKSVKKALPLEMPGWTLVVDEEAVFLEVSGSVTTKDKDPVRVYQKQDTLECVLAFTGTNSAPEFKTTMDMEPARFCGIDGVHRGYAKEIRQITYYLWQFVKPALSKCSKVSVVGHSLGGAISELFSACINSGHAEEEDFKLMAWAKEEPELLPELAPNSTVHQVFGDLDHIKA